ncbi:hypothetical protein JT069_04800 [Helicobacter pylori]|uniref:hypothetical protein n=1 Tax=Helicobacter pylori TaxID=210 RepID=UPI00346664AC|nr:hypothetical protein [Helicobacter pylori]
MKAEHNEQVEALENKLKEQDKHKTKFNALRYRQAQHPNQHIPKGFENERMERTQ